MTSTRYADYFLYSKSVVNLESAVEQADSLEVNNKTVISLTSLSPNDVNHYVPLTICWSERLVVLPYADNMTSI